MAPELLVRFLIGGAVVLAFSALGEVLTPKTFSGLFGAAPSVALASLSLSYAKHGGLYAGAEARSMVLGSVALFVYCLSCVAIMKRERWPAWSVAGFAWLPWLAVAFGALALARMLGGMS